MNKPPVRFEVESGLCGHGPFVRITLNSESIVLHPEDALNFAERVREAVDAIAMALQGTDVMKGASS